MSDNPSKPYESPVSLLMDIGRPESFDFNDSNYLPCGFTSEHVPELLRLAQDSFYLELDEDDPRVYAGVHAMRVLGQLQHPDAMAALIQMAETRNDDADGWIVEELPEIIASYGAHVLPMLKEGMERHAHNWNRAYFYIGALDQMPSESPETRLAIIDIATGQLRQAATNDRIVNGELVGILANLKAVESLPVIESAFAGNYVDVTMSGDWDDIQVKFGLKEPDPNRKPFPPEAYGLPPDFNVNMFSGLPQKLPGKPVAKADKKAKNKRKEAKKARKKNRR